MSVNVTQPRDPRTEMKAGFLNQASGGRGGLTLADQMRVNQRLVQGNATQGNADEEKDPN